MQINSFKSHFIPNICMHLRIEYVVFRKEKIKFIRIYYENSVTQLNKFYLFIPKNALVQLPWNYSAIG